MNGKCKCCGEQFKTSNKQTGRQKFCSSRCREKHWTKNNPKRVKELSKAFRLKKEVFCSLCNKKVSNDLRHRGVTFCSKGCKDKQRKITAKTIRDKAAGVFSSIKISIGCQLCQYKKCSASLDFHHKNAEEKETRISPRMLKSNKPEVDKCCLLCKNCHYEMHELQRTKPTDYQKVMKGLKSLLSFPALVQFYKSNQ